MPHGYDHILRHHQLDKAQTEALQLQYPPLLLELAMQVYTGPKAIVAEQEMTPFFTVHNGVPAGCLLAPALRPWKTQRAGVFLSSWVVDVGFDTAGQSSLQRSTTKTR